MLSRDRSPLAAVILVVTVTVALGDAFALIAGGASGVVAVARDLGALIGLTGLMGAVLAWVTPVDGLTAYLATTPGGLFAVLATAADSGSDVTYVISVQLFRLIVILMIVPLLARWLRSSPTEDQRGSKQ